jgi:hypothetical protein
MLGRKLLRLPKAIERSGREADRRYQINQDLVADSAENRHEVCAATQPTKVSLNNHAFLS